MIELWGLVGQHSRRPRRQGYLVCPEVGVDPIDVPSNVRECACGAQVWVSPGSSARLLDSGQLEAQCPGCWQDSGAGLLMHPDTEAELRAMGRRALELGWKRIAAERQAQADWDDTTTGA